jgi:eukaryotic-like serine/threonine-protein kinase
VWQRTQVPSFPVPPLVGLEQGRALNLIAPNGWDVQVVTERNDTQDAGIVFRQAPDSGRLDEGEPFVLYVSEGPTLSPLPEISGRPLADVTADLEALQLSVNVVEERFDEAIPAGTVMAWSVAGQSLPVGSEVLKGTVVDVVVSKGPAPRVVPEAVNRPYDEVAAELTANRLVPNRLEDQFSDTVEAGLILAIDPPAGTEVVRDTTVNIVVSKGPDVVTVPPLAGLTLDAATQALTAAGLAPGQAAGPVTGTVLASDPASGQVVRRGTTVNLLLT